MNNDKTTTTKRNPGQSRAFIKFQKQIERHFLENKGLARDSVLKTVPLKDDVLTRWKHIDYFNPDRQDEEMMHYALFLYWCLYPKYQAKFQKIASSCASPYEFERKLPPRKENSLGRALGSRPFCLLLLSVATPLS